MKILYFYINDGKMMQNWQKFHIFDELKIHNIVVDTINPLKYKTIKEANEDLLKTLDSNHYDLFMTPHDEQIIYIKTLKNIKIKKLLICFDNLIIPYKHKKIARYFDLVWITSDQNREYFKRISKKVIFRPYAANPIMANSNPNRIIRRIVFVGSPYGSRANLINFLTKNKIRVDIFSNLQSFQKIKHNEFRFNFKIISDAFNFLKSKIGRKLIYSKLIQIITNPTSSKLNTLSPYLKIYNSVSIRKISKIYSKYSLCLSSTDVRNTGILKNPVKIVNLRSFEIPMSGGLQVCSYSKELATYFEENKEIIFFKNKSDLLNKVNFYLAADNKIINQMKDNAKAKAIKSHTWYNRFLDIFKELNLLENI